MASVVLACQFCTTLNRINLDRLNDRPACQKCQKPYLLDRPVKVEEENFQRTVLESEVPVLVDFYADWCGPCRMMAPLLDEIAGQHAGKLLVAKVDTDRAPALSRTYHIRSIPFFARFENGEMVKSVIGADRNGLLGLAA